MKASRHPLPHAGPTPDHSESRLFKEEKTGIFFLTVGKDRFSPGAQLTLPRGGAGRLGPVPPGDGAKDGRCSEHAASPLTEEEGHRRRGEAWAWPQRWPHAGEDSRLCSLHLWG